MLDVQLVNGDDDRDLGDSAIDGSNDTLATFFGERVANSVRGTRDLSLNEPQAPCP